MLGAGTKVTTGSSVALGACADTSGFGKRCLPPEDHSVFARLGVSVRELTWGA